MAEPLFWGDVEPLFPNLLIVILHTITHVFTINRRDNGSMVCFLVIYLLNCLYLILGDGIISCFCMFVFLPCSHLVLLEFICLLFSDVYKNVYCHGPVVYIFFFFCVLYHIIAIFIDISSHDVSNEKKNHVYEAK